MRAALMFLVPAIITALYVALLVADLFAGLQF